MSNDKLNLEATRARANALIESGALPSGSDDAQHAWRNFAPFARSDLRVLLGRIDELEKEIAVAIKWLDGATS